MSKKLKIFGILAIAALLIVPGNTFADQYFGKGMVGEAGTIQNTFVINAANRHLRLYRAFVAIPGEMNAQVIIGSLSCTSDGTADTNNAYIYDKEDDTNVNAAAVLGASVIPTVDTGTAFDVNDIVCIQSPSGDVVQVETVANVGGGSIAIYGILDQAIGLGWRVYEMEEISRVVVQNATVNRESAIATIVGEADSPVLVLLGGGAACAINFCSGYYR